MTATARVEPHAENTGAPALLPPCGHPHNLYCQTIS
jgi:hypothetical protein